jgi:signal transduction histidine kinase
MSRILLVEDSKVQAVVTQRLLERAGHNVQHVGSVEEAVKVCYESTPDLVVSDQELGEVSGLELCRRIKSDMALSVIPVLMLTGSQVRRQHVAALDAGADAFLSKDSSPEELLAVVSRLLENSVSVRALSAAGEEPGGATHRSRILAVDDSPTFLGTLCKKLVEAGFEVTAAGSGGEALPLLDRESFDVAVTDVVMPEMDGFEFARRARQWALECNRQLGVLVLTGSERKDVLVQSLEAGADDYVNKAQDMDVIVAHATALARRVTRTRQIESINEQALRKEHALREAELKREQAEERARLADELERANQALAESNEQLNQFASVASHDLQAPLRRVVSFCELLKAKENEKFDEESRMYLEFIVSSAQGMQQLISDLLTYSRVDTHDKPRERTDCSLILRAVLSNLGVMIQETGAAVTHENLPTLPAYRTQFVQLFQNLIGNAINYRGSEPPRIHVSAEAGEGEWTFRVKDNGIGIHPRHREEIFLMFKRLHGSERAGSGIGLATCKKIIERHGGRIWVESEPGKGSTFCFTIPEATDRK